ncbi:uncharacterized protein [Littorina saxatilis]|uniref:uncharacterized protein n=1 Tax=Littorina saxatilis TaxID=31220 RepID=UPI0038B5218C
MDMIVTDNADAGDLVQSMLEVTVTQSDNSTCFTSINSPYFYLPPPKIWVTSETPLPVPMMQQFQGVVNVLITNPDSLGASAIEVRTPSEESSREVILTIQSLSIDHVNGFTDASTNKAKDASLYKMSTFGSFQNDISQISLAPLQLNAVNFSNGDLGMKFSVRAEDYSQLSDGDVVNVSVAMTLGQGDDVSGRGGASLIWVSSVAATLQAPPLELKRPELNLTLSQKASCAYDGETRAIIDVELFHDTTSTATAYNVTARVYLTEATTLLRHTSSELRQNSLSVAQTANVVYIEIERMTFSDPTTVTLSLDIDLSDPRTRFAKYHVITADAIFADRWGNTTGMFTAIDFVSLQLHTRCSQRLNWTQAGSCVCSHNNTRTDCACCASGACQCGQVNPEMCLPCDRLHLCQPFLKGFDAITELDADDGKTTYICDAYYRYRVWSGGVSCYRRTFNGGSHAWYPISPVVGAITSRDIVTGNLYGISNNGLARMLSVDSSVTWYTMPEDYVSQVPSANIVEATLIPGQLEE